MAKVIRLIINILANIYRRIICYVSHLKEHEKILSSLNELFFMETSSNF